MRIIHIDSFGGDAAELKPKDRTIENLVKALKTSPRLSYWDLCENRWLRELVKVGIDKGLIEEVYDIYPWFRYKITNK